MAEQGEYKVELEVFEGPLDLLLYLIKKEEVDIYNIPIERITTQYMQYLSFMRMLDLNIAGEFLVMAATLMMIKSRMLLPVEERSEDEEEEGDDPRWDLIRQLVEYKKFKDAAARLQDMESRQEDIFGMGVVPTVTDTEGPTRELRDVSLFDLIAAFGEALKRAKPEQIGDIMAERYSVADKIALILELTQRRQNLVFGELFRAGAPVREIVCTFLALLELIRLRQVKVRQEGAFGEILIEAGGEDAVPLVVGAMAQEAEA
jgi:segregation and condensation protein A